MCAAVIESVRNPNTPPGRMLIRKPRMRQKASFTGVFAGAIHEGCCVRARWSPSISSQSARSVLSNALGTAAANIGLTPGGAPARSPSEPIARTVADVWTALNPESRMSGMRGRAGRGGSSESRSFICASTSRSRTPRLKSSCERTAIGTSAKSPSGPRHTPSTH
eukprot:scaffold5475_cov127-Isochrysis_galbana.AAC.4